LRKNRRFNEEMQTLKELVEQLSPDLQEEVRNFVEFLIKKQKDRPRSKPRFDWSDSLKDMRDQYGSVEMQHKISKWRIGEE
jgi:hypothetical protein